MNSDSTDEKYGDDATKFRSSAELPAGVAVAA